MSDSVQSIERAFALLRALATAPAGISEVARRTGLATSTTARLLHTLEELGAVERLATSPVQFRVGAAIGELAAGLDPDAALVVRARPYLVDLVATVGETAGVSVPVDDWSLLYLEHCESEHVVQLRDWTGVTVPMHVVSSGLVALASKSPAELDEYFSTTLERFTDRTVTDPTLLRERLREVAARGVAWTVEEYVEGISSVAAPVRRDGRVVAALHVHGPSYRFPQPDRVHAIEAALVAAAAAVSADG